MLGRLAWRDGDSWTLKERSMSYMAPIPNEPVRFSGTPLPMWAHDDDFDHLHLDEEFRKQIAKTIADHDVVRLATVGIDIGSSTSHLLFARVTLQREGEQMSSRFTVVGREVIWRSPITLTPFLADGPIDAARLERFIHECYESAGLKTSDIDCGAVILTGEAIKRENARAIDELFASEAGKFVCATAGHQLEATLAAHGSGAVRVSKERDIALLHVDIGGGTTKMALIDRGHILGVAAFAVGGRLIAQDDGGTWSRLDEAAQLAAKDLGIALDAASAADPATREKIAARLAHVLVDYITDTPRDALGKSLLLTGELDRSVVPAAVSFSGGVAEYLFARETADFGDIAQLLAGSVRRELPQRVKVQAIDPGVGIRATVIGASQFTVQVSGTTIFISDFGVLPMRNVRVVALKLPEPFTAAAIAADIHAGILRNNVPEDVPLALAIEWDRAPRYPDLLELSQGIFSALGAQRTEHSAPLVLLIDGDIAKSIGHILCEELRMRGPLVSIDGVRLQDLDFVDVGELVKPQHVIPLVIKSLVFH
jgi:ethanolamine utilization protein EutA